MRDADGIRNSERIKERNPAMANGTTAHRSLLPTALLAAGLLATACGGGAHVGNAAPRLTEVPQQATVGGSTFTIDLDDYVTDREGATLTFAVMSGGGSFTDSVYANMFDTMGDYEVQFSVSDGQKTSTGSFRVRVTSADFAVVREDTSGVLLLDTATATFVRVAGSTVMPTLAAGLGDGRLVYQLAAPAGDQLWVFDPLTRSVAQIAPGASGDVTYRARTSTNRILYTTGSGDDQHLYFYNPVTGVSRDLAEGVLSTVTVLVNASDLVFYEVGTNGQADVFSYDPTTDEITTVGDAVTDEQLQAVLPNGAVVFTRLGGSGETDLWYFRLGTGLVEVGADASSIANLDKVYHGCGSGNQVVFAARTGSVSDIWFWNPSGGQSTSISAVFTAGAYDLFSTLGDGNEVVFQRVVSGSEADAFFYDLDSATSGTVRNSSDISQVLGTTNDGTTAWALVRPSGSTSDLLAVSLVASPVTRTWSAGGAVSTSLGALANGDVVAQRSDGTALNVFDVSTGMWSTPITGAGLAFGGDGLDDGDFVYALTASSQTDLSMWDASATASVVVSDADGDDAFQAVTLHGTVLFTRVVTGNTNADLFVWDGSTATRLTAGDNAELLHDYTVVGQYSGSR